VRFLPEIVTVLKELANVYAVARNCIYLFLFCVSGERNLAWRSRRVEQEWRKCLHFVLNMLKKKGICDMTGNLLAKCCRKMYRCVHVCISVL
jgi:hypothetical protein